ncbi:MAG: hypothetical protein KBF63_04325 [Rhodoferax sp.]|jgi:hypothetical protein|nr:hypothetical protein [Rhodoferax sp.]MBP9928479.1 hypothetical protein [Rhodoferax sp.]HQX57650.1 hypothetical protein [Burkholderiaceae bacterium]HQZ06259.1 hypothetical protein [Burkholderiaceae bacterium]HRA61852.1 hypothetical protein [Burkholderiaceae bacterium]
MPTDTREFLDRTQPDIALPMVAVPRRVDIDLPLGRIAEPDRVASRRGFAPTLSQVAAYPLRWREGAHPRAVGQVDAA